MPRAFLACLFLAGVTSSALAQSADSVQFAENFSKDVQYHVDCQVNISGTLPVPPTAKEANPKPLQLSGNSTIRYDERILQLAANGRAERTLRYYQQIEFHRTVNDDKQQNQLRPEVRKLVILRQNQYEVPFCPTAPLTWGEIELIRTDVFAPALAGLFPAQAQRVGQSWKADLTAVQELTDLEKIDAANFVCKFEQITNHKGRRYAYVTFDGQVKGVGDDGNSLHEMRGSFHYDIEANFLAYLSVKGTHHLLNRKGEKVGKIEGTFVMARTRTLGSTQLSPEANRDLALEPNATNTLLVFENTTMGVRVTHPRNWRVVGGNKSQIGIDEHRGAGMLITVTPGASTPTGAQFYQETMAFFQKQQQAKIAPKEMPRVVQSGLETFMLEGKVGNDQLGMRYYVVRQGNHGATIAVRIPQAGVQVLQPEVDRMVRSLQLGVK